MIDGLDNVELHIAQCCQPVHGESIGGYITLNRGVSIHKVACPDYLRMTTQEPERAVEADWEMQPTRGQRCKLWLRLMIVVVRSKTSPSDFLRSNQYSSGQYRILRRDGIANEIVD